MNGIHQKGLANWRYQIFIITWIGYAGFYLCRKNFAIAKGALDETYGFTNFELSWIWTGYLAMYAIGQFVNGFLNDLRGPRFMVGLGLIVAAGSTFLCGYGSSVGVFAVLLGLNGFAQATGWPGLVKCMGNWFVIKERGRVMGWWGTCFAVGGLLSTVYATFLFDQYNQYLINTVGVEAATRQAWKIIFWGPSITLFIIAIAFVIFVRDTPKEAGFEELDEFEGMPDSTDDSKETANVPIGERNEFWAALKQVFNSRTVWIYCAVYFCLKFIRYGMLSWLPKYAKDELGYDLAQAGYLSVGFELAAPLGVIFCGYMSDKVFGAKRTPICCILMFLLVGCCLLESQMAYWSMTWYFLGLCVIGFCVFGPDALLSGPAAQDFGSKRAAGMCAGLINGVGSLGAMLQEPLIGWATDNYANAWSWLFYGFAGLSLISALMISFTWNDIPKHHADRK